ncbi:MuDR family transposase [Striga hermonthica]|uniref:MuDR family transposase n=1 Tax=Striga hermonthica TaxID=68872 RepID=A0A9N7R954_STRHE|nr:MuDR family transposase [Striga hermonthica]
MKKAEELIHMRSDEWNFQIMGPFEQHTVDVLGRSCSCRKWELTGLPCKHAISAIWCRKEEPGWYVDHLYTVETYRKAYELPILGINGPDLWPNVELPLPIPPVIVKRPGRPKKVKRRNPTEPPSSLPHNPLRLKKHQRSVTCRVCGEHGHNARKHKKADQNEEQEEIPVSEPQPPLATDNVFSSQSLAPTPANNNNDAEASRNRSEEKRRTTRKRKSSQLDGNGNEDQGQTVNATQSEGVPCPVVVKRVVNYITVSNIRATLRPRNGAAPGKDKAGNK